MKLTRGGNGPQLFPYKIMTAIRIGILPISLSWTEVGYWRAIYDFDFAESRYLNSSTMEGLSNVQSVDRQPSRLAVNIGEAC
ncbi:unnamed protein product [Enterobius vermicularis]|uniref:Uncharacterized protein n=1 Tax=Enterobius vermicularis TaxID=51028 RepID=A0A0N4UYU6_ENTVE|nr:unnamed protein product [Enterobius vermicularis]